MMKKIEGHPNLRRAPNGSIISIDNISIARAKLKKQNQEELKSLRIEVNDLKEQINNLNLIVQELKNGR